MIKALAIKELRESAGLVALAVLGTIGLFGPLMGVSVLPGFNSSAGWYPFVNEGHLSGQGFVLGLFAFALGLKQTAFESHQGTFYFLLHRPLRRENVFVVKLLVGVVAVVAVNALMILLYGFWSSRPGSHPSPFFWSMTLTSCKLGVALLLVYLGAFLSGVRPARWFGSKLVPLAVAGVCVAVIMRSTWWWYSLTIGLMTSAAMLVAIFYYIRTRDQ